MPICVRIRTSTKFPPYLIFTIDSINQRAEKKEQGHVQIDLCRFFFFLTEERTLSDKQTNTFTHKLASSPFKCLIKGMIPVKLFGLGRTTLTNRTNNKHQTRERHSTDSKEIIPHSNFSPLSPLSYDFHKPSII